MNMKATRFYTLLAFLLMAGGVTMQAQEQLANENATNLFKCQKAQDCSPTQQPSIVSETSEWIHYDDGIYNCNLAYMPENIPFSWAVMFPPELLKSYKGYTLTKVALYENEWNTGDLLLSVFYGNSYMPLTLLSQQTITTWDLDSFDDIDLAQQVEIDETQYLWIVFSELAATETYSAACSWNTVDPNPNARWLQCRENEWEDAAVHGLPYVQFMIWAYVTDDPLGVETQLTPMGSNVYPNPGKDMLNIRTGLKDAWVEVYDMNGRMVYRQEITENVTAINTTDWSEGTYVWKVVSNGIEVENGKWIKQ